MAGAVKSIKKLHTGSLFIETAISAQFTVLLYASALFPYPIWVEAHWQLNFSMAVISYLDLLEVSTGELAAELAAQCVVAIQCIQSHHNGVLQPSVSLNLTFSLPTLPDKFSVAFYWLPVHPCVPNHMYCFKSVSSLAMPNWPINLSPL